MRPVRVTLFVAGAVVTALACSPHQLQAQRLADLQPGTLVRLTTRAGAQLEGPLAEVRADSVHLSSTERRAAIALPLSSLNGYEYADGKESGHGMRGAIIGTAIGMSAALLLTGRGNGGSDGSMFLSRGFVSTTVVLLGAGIGFAIGESDAPPHWVIPARPASPR